MNEKRTIAPDLEHSLVGGSTERRLDNSRRAPLTGPLILSFYTDGQQRQEAEAWFDRRPLAMEIGFGRGHFLSERAKQRPQMSFVGFEIRQKWCKWLQRHAVADGLSNLRIVHDDARSVIARYLAPESLTELYVNFPDPWWKRRHMRRRLMAPAFVELASTRLIESGWLYFKTDVEEFAHRAYEAVEAHGGFDLQPLVASHELDLPHTYREQRYIRRGQPTFGLAARRLSQSV